MASSNRHSRAKKRKRAIPKQQPGSIPGRREVDGKIIYDFGVLSNEDLEGSTATSVRELGGLLVDEGKPVDELSVPLSGKTIAIAAGGAEDAFEALRFGEPADAVASDGDEAVALARKLLPEGFEFSGLDFTTHSYFDSFNQKVVCGWSIFFHAAEEPSSH